MGQLKHEQEERGEREMREGSESGVRGKTEEIDRQARGRGEKEESVGGMEELARREGDTEAGGEKERRRRERGERERGREAGKVDRTSREREEREEGWKTEERELN